VNIPTDQQLLRDYADCRSEAAFAELVRRYVDLVYSAALRMVRDAHLAEDVTQGVFVALARNARQLADHPVLAGWLHRTAQNLAANIVRSDVRRRLREKKAAVMNELISAEPDVLWEQIAPHLDAALNELSELDQAALLLRYFQNKSAREMAQILDTTEDAAQKRVSRAVDRLRELFSKRGVTIGAGGLVVVISANAVQAAPAGLAAAISSAAVLAGATVATTATATITKAIAMSTLQKTLITATIAATAGTGIYEAHQASTLRDQVQTFQQQQAPSTEQILELERQRDDAMNRLAMFQQENEQLRQNMAELLKLRGEVAQLRATKQQLAQSKTTSSDTNDPFAQYIQTLTARAAELNQHLEQMPDKKIPELQLLGVDDWLKAAQDAKFDTDADVRKALSKLRSLAKGRLRMDQALGYFARANNGQLPNGISQLKPYLKSALKDLDDATIDSILERYTLLHTGKLSDLPPKEWLVVEKAPVDKDYDSRAKFGNWTSTVISTGIGESGDPDDKSY